MHDRLVLAAHGTASPAGLATLHRIRDAVAADRPGVEVALCFLDVIGPRLAETLDDRPTVVVPALLSTGYHVQADLPEAVASRPAVRVARHLGPHPLLADALADRLPPGDATVVLAASGSSRPAAAADRAAAADLLADRLRRAVRVVTVGPTVREQLAGIEGPLQVATYLLAEGAFLDGLRDAVAGRGAVAPPLGAHSSVVELIWRRYDAVEGTR